MDSEDNILKARYDQWKRIIKLSADLEVALDWVYDNGGPSARRELEDSDTKVGRVYSLLPDFREAVSEHID